MSQKQTKKKVYPVCKGPQGPDLGYDLPVLEHISAS